MGNVFSSASTGARASGNVTINSSETMNNTSDSCEDENKHTSEFDDESDSLSRARAKEIEMNEFQKELNIKREQRRQILAKHRAERDKLENNLEAEKRAKLQLIEANKLLRELLVKNNIEIPDNIQSLEGDSNDSSVTELKEEWEKIKSNNTKLRRDLAETNYSLQNAYSNIAELNAQNIEAMKHISALKEVVSVSKTMIGLREEQLNELKNKLMEIERSLADKEANMLSIDLRQEYERQLQNIRTLRGLYEERARLAEVTRQGLVRDLEEHKVLYQTEVSKCKDLSARVEELETKVDNLLETIDNKNDQISTCQNETRGLKVEMLAVNKLFSQVLLGYKSNHDLDKLIHRLEENHGILTHMAEKENGSEASTALPKLLLELVSQVDEAGDNSSETSKQENSEGNEQTLQNNKEAGAENSLNTSAQEIVENLPKVWRVLMELLSHQTEVEPPSTDKVTTCFKSVDTKSGPVLVPSVSQTYIRLKDLIVEKLALVKEVNRMKQLNSHLETRLGEQERRLCLVTTELSKTWHVVGRLRRHHHQLHTHEKILKYELQQKRKLLNELKEELEYCREKWEQAREKNSQSERDWRKLRAEFSSRRSKPNLHTLNNSAESGYSDERPSDESSESNDESEYVTEPLIRSKKKFKKSFETVIDSSTDFNLAAEREDPASDMLDVADLPLDTQEGDDDHGASASDCISENLSKSEKICEETEDEIADIIDSCAEESSAVEHYCDTDFCCVGQSSSKDESGGKDTNYEEKCESDEKGTTVVIDPAKILESIKQQNERLAKKEKKLENLEKNSARLLKKSQVTSMFSKQINNTLDHLLNRPTTSKQCNIPKTDIDAIKDTDNFKDAEECKNVEDVDPVQTRTLLTSSDIEYIHDDSHISSTNNESNLEKLVTETMVDQNINSINVEHFCDNTTQDMSIKSPETRDKNETSETSNTQIQIGQPQEVRIDPKTILENVKRQNERLAKREERLQNLEQGCSNVVKSMSNTLDLGNEIITKLNTLHDTSQNQNIERTTHSEQENENSGPSREDSEPSTSSEIDHEARFAARDLRLKRLEEQTKSLVKKVNKTTTKGVKIHYKLEELHNIYGSENSRAGTPSEDNDERTENNNNNEPSDE